MADSREPAHHDLLDLVRDFVARDVLPVVTELERNDIYPQALLDKMADLGFFGLTIPTDYGGIGLPLEMFAQIQLELTQGWMSLSGALTAHHTAATMIHDFGTQAQREELLPRMASGELRFCFSMTEPDAGSDVQAIRTRAVLEGDDYVLTGAKTWATHGLNSSALMLLAVTDPDARPRHRGMTIFVIEKAAGLATLPGLEISPSLPKLGYKGVESNELVFDGFRTPAISVLGGPGGLGNGFRYIMAGLEVGRLSVAACAAGIATDALQRAIRYSQERETFGKPIADHQAIQLLLAQMATRVHAARLVVLDAARRKDTGERVDLEMGMAKLLGGYGYSAEFGIERLFREAPSLVLGEGSNEIQQLLIARRLLERRASA